MAKGISQNFLLRMIVWSIVTPCFLDFRSEPPMTKEEMMAIYATAEEPMVFVRREAGVITCAWMNWSDEATEILPEAHPDVVSFRANQPGA